MGDKPLFSIGAGIYLAPKQGSFNKPFGSAQRGVELKLPPYILIRVIFLLSGYVSRKKMLSRISCV
jgi:hypothetical protein